MEVWEGSLDEEVTRNYCQDGVPEIGQLCKTKTNSIETIRQYCSWIDV